LECPLRSAVYQNLSANVETLDADARCWSRKHQPFGCAPLATERTLDLCLLACQRQEAACGGAVGHALFRARNTGVTDEYVWSGDEFGGSVLREFAEGAGKIAFGIARTPNALPPTSTRAANHLLYTLMAQLECLGYLPQGAAGQMHSPDQAVIIRTGDLNLVLGFSKLGSGSAGFLK